MLLKLLKEEKPYALAVAFDRPKPTFRHEAFDGYKAHRGEIPAELPGQFPLTKAVLEAMHIPMFEMDGFEADDILCTIGLKAADRDYDVLIVTGDKDALQLVRPHIEVMATRKGITDTVIYDSDGVLERYGITPAQVTDLIGLKGDPSDNIPGVPGIGEKTAARLLGRFGTLEGVYEHLDEITQAKLKENLMEHEVQARFSKELATLRPDVPLEIDEERLRYTGGEAAEVEKLFTELEFKSLIKRVEQVMGKPAKPLEADLVKRTVALDGAAIAELKGLVEGADTGFVVTDGEEAAIAIALADGTVYSGLVTDELDFYLGSDGARKVTHDAKTAKKALDGLGRPLAGVCFDTMLAAYLLDPGRHGYGLDALAGEYLGEYSGTGGDEEARCRDAALTLRLRDEMAGEILRRGLKNLFRVVELPLSFVLARMEETGVAVDTDQLAGLAKELATSVDGLEADIYGLAGEEFNINSPQQLGVVLFERLGIESAKKKRTKTGYSTSYDVLVKLLDAHPIVEKVLEYRELTKVKSTYVDALPPMVGRDGRLHTYFNQVGTATGRLASEKPNLQNIPVRGEWGARIRAAFVAGEPGWGILSADYSQIELRILAHLAMDERLLEAFARGEDIHAATAKVMLGLADAEVTAEHRRIAKAINFGLMYGMSPFGLAEHLGIPDGEAAEYIKRYFEQYPATKAFIDRIVEEARDAGFVTTLLGRIRYIPELASKNFGVARLGERLAVNTTIQGSAADIIKLAMIGVDRRLQRSGMRTRMVLQIHDELVFEVPEDERETAQALVKEEMEGALELKAPLEVNLAYGHSWGEAHN